MITSPTFGSFLGAAPLRKNDDAALERVRFLFAGWSYEPLTAKYDESLIVATDQNRIV